MSGRRAGPALRLGGVTLIPIVVTHVAGDSRMGVGWIAGGMNPVALVIADRHGPRAQDMDGQPLAMERLLEEMPELDKMLGRSTPS